MCETAGGTRDDRERGPDADRHREARAIEGDRPERDPVADLLSRVRRTAKRPATETVAVARDAGGSSLRASL